METRKILEQMNENRRNATTDKLSTLSNTLYKYTGAFFFSLKRIFARKTKMKNGRRGDS
jgi:uncharacterized protein YutD